MTLVGLIVGALMVVWQLGRQNKSSLALQREGKREELKLQIYQALIQKINGVTDKIGEAWMYVFVIPGNIEMRMTAVGYQPSPLEQRVPKFIGLNGDALRGVVEVMFEFEAWSIAFPEAQVFQIALNSASFDAREAFSPLVTALTPILPMDHPPAGSAQTTTPIHPLPSKTQLEQLKVLINRYWDAMSELSAYLSDLKVEAQNNLLSGLFEHHVPLRQPIDPRHKVISTEPEKAKELIRYFECDTPWGKNQAVTNARVKEAIAQRNEQPSGNSI